MGPSLPVIPTRRGGILSGSGKVLRGKDEIQINGSLSDFGYERRLEMRGKSYLSVILVLLLSLLALPVASCGDEDKAPTESASPTTTEPATEEPTPTAPAADKAEPAKFVVALSLEPSVVRPQEPVTITAKVVNTGEESGVCNLELFVGDNVEETKSVALAGSEEVTIPFKVQRKEPGTYTARIAESSLTFKVEREVTSPCGNKWFFETRGAVNFSPAVASDGTIYISSDAHRIYALNPDGSLKWTFETELPVRTCPVIASDGTIYVGVSKGGSGYGISRGGEICALTPYGGLKWTFGIRGSVDLVPAIGPDGTVYVASCIGDIYAINPDGELKWSFSTGDFFESSPTIASDGTVYAGTWDTWDGKMYALHPDGSVLWSSDIVALRSSPTIGSDGTIYIGGIHAVSPAGKVKWFSPVGRANCSPAIAPDGTIYVGAPDHKMCALNPDGSLKWCFEGKAEVSSSPAVACDGTIYVGTSDEKICALNPDGKCKCTFDVPDYTDSPPTIAPDGTIYVGSLSGLYALADQNGGLADSGWPMFRHDPQHSGRQSAAVAPAPTPSVSTISVKTQAYGTGQIKTLSMEDEYLPVVVACENGNAPYESLKAQAVASRSYAIYKKLIEPASQDYDLLDSQADQVYNPETFNNLPQSKQKEIREAVEETEGLVLKYANKVVCAFYVSGTGTTEKYVTLNEGKGGDGIMQTDLGWVTNPPSKNPHNRGCMGQVQANELASEGYAWQEILKYFYGSDIAIKD